MKKMNKHTGDLSVLFNDYTKQAAMETAEPLNQGERIMYIRVSDIEKHPDNPMDEREIEDLASQIVVNGYHIETVEVRPLENGKYRLISGHRRTAAKRLLLERGEVTDDTIPCIIRTFEPSPGSILTSDEMEIIALINANRGQRRGRKLDERIREAKLLEPIARKVYEAEKSKGNLKGVSFRKFFAQAALNESETTLQRFKSLEKLTEKAKAAVMAGKISETAAAQLASLPPIKQDVYILKLLNGDDNFEDGLDEPEQETGIGTVKHVEEYVQSVKKEEQGIEEEPDNDGPEEPEEEPKTEEKPKKTSSKKPKSGPEPEETVSTVQKEADGWVSEKLEEYHRKNDKVCFMQLINLCKQEMDDTDDTEARSQWDLRRAAAQLAYDREIKRETES